MHLTRGRVLAAVCLALIWGAVVAAPAARATEGNVAADEKAPDDATARQVGDLSLADRLIDHGLAARDPLALLTAAKIVRQTPVQQTTRSAEEVEDGATPTFSGTGTGPAPAIAPAPSTGGMSLDDLLGGGGTARQLSLDDLLGGGSAAAPPAGGTGGFDRSVDRPTTFEEIIASARSMAQGQPTVLALVDEISRLPPPTATRGRVGGPAYSRDYVMARREDWYRMTFRARQRAAVSLRGYTGADLDLYIYDQNRNLICADTNSTGRGYCRWVPRWTGPFFVRIKNWSNRGGAYRLRTN